MAFPLKRGSKTTKYGKASSWREKKKMQLMTLESHFNHVWVIGIQMKGYHVFLLPHFWDPSFDSYLKC